VPIIQFSEADKLAGATMDKGGYPAILSELAPPAASKSGKSVTYWATFRITAGKYEGKELRVGFNTETNASSILGTVQFMPAGNLLMVAAAVQKIKFEDVPLNVDTDSLVNQPLDLMISPEASEGNLVNRIDAFLPSGASSTANQY
jgi:hypothetical protein